MPSKKEKQQQQQQAALLAMKAQTAALTNSTNTIGQTPVGKPSQTTTNTNTKVADRVEPNDRLSLLREQKTELDELNHRFSNYVLALRKRSQENEELQKQVDQEKQQQSPSIVPHVRLDFSSSF